MPPRTALLLLAVAAPAGSGSGAPAHLTYMTDFDSSYFPARAQPLQHTWLNFLLPVVADACTEKHGPVCLDALAGITHGWERYGKRSLYTELPDLHGSALPPLPQPQHTTTPPPPCTHRALLLGHQTARASSTGPTRGSIRTGTPTSQPLPPRSAPSSPTAPAPASSSGCVEQ